MKKVLIPTILVATIIIAASFALMPVQRAVTTHLPSIAAGAIAPGSVGTTELATGAVTNAKLGTDAVTTGKILDGEVKTADIETSVSAITGVTSAKIADGTITTTDISGTAGITGGQLAANTITPTQLANTLTLDAATSIVTSGANTLTFGDAGATSFRRLIITQITVDLPAVGANAESCITSLAVTGITTTDIAVATPNFDLVDGFAVSRARVSAADTIQVCVMETAGLVGPTNPDAAGGSWNVIVLDLT